MEKSEFFEIIENTEKLTDKSITHYKCAIVKCLDCPFHLSSSGCLVKLNKSREDNINSVNKMINSEYQKYLDIVEYRPLEILPEDLIA